MIKIKTDIVVGIAFMIFTYAIAQFNGVVFEGTDLFLLKSIEGLAVNLDDSILISITLWIIPKLLLSYYLANNVFRSYKTTYAYYFVRLRNPAIWMKRVFSQLHMSSCVFLLLKLALASMIGFSMSLLTMVILEIFLIVFMTIIIFIVMLLTDSEKLSILSIVVVITALFLITKTQNMKLIDIVFMYEKKWLSCLILLSLNIANLAIIFALLKHKEFYY